MKASEVRKADPHFFKVQKMTHQNFNVTTKGKLLGDKYFIVSYVNWEQKLGKVYRICTILDSQVRYLDFYASNFKSAKSVAKMLSAGYITLPLEK